MDSLEADDHLTIVNRSMENRISKKLIRKIPYFEKMLDHDLKESKENKVVLDFDETTFKWFLNWIEFGNTFIEMDFVINLCNMADYFGITDGLIDDCFTYFHGNFSIEHLPVIIPQVTSTSKLVNSGALNAFICRYFLKIVNTPTWLDYPVETIGYICVLDLMVHSEFQVFYAITRWVNHEADSRKRSLKDLLKCVRWKDEDLSKMNGNEVVKSSEFESESCSHDKPDCHCSVDASIQGYFVVIEELSATDLQVQILDSNFLPLINQVIQSDESLPLYVLHDEHVSDIPFDSGRKMIRIDWSRNKYRLLDYPAYKSHCLKMIRCISEEQKSECGSVQTSTPSTNSTNSTYESSVLEAAEKFILVRIEPSNFIWRKNPSISDVNEAFQHYGQTFLTTILDNNIYLLKNNLDFFQFNINRSKEFRKIGLQKFQNKLKFDNLILTSKQANDDRVILADKITKDVFCFNVTTQEWKSMGRIIDYKSKSTDGQKESNVLKTFTFGFISSDTIKLCSKSKRKRKLTQ